MENRLLENSECSICLCDFAEGDECRTLPVPCSHTFHSKCIDEWLRLSSACPLCTPTTPVMFPRYTYPFSAFFLFIFSGKRSLRALLGTEQPTASSSQPPSAPVDDIRPVSLELPSQPPHPIRNLINAISTTRGVCRINVIRNTFSINYLHPNYRESSSARQNVCVSASSRRESYR